MYAVVVQDTSAEADGKAFYESDEDSRANDFVAKRAAKKPTVMDADHRLLLRNARPLLNSRNAAVSEFLR